MRNSLLSVFDGDEDDARVHQNAGHNDNLEEEGGEDEQRGLARSFVSMPELGVKSDQCG